MNKLNVNLENCYGIKKLETKFDFSQNKVYAIYAPNGVMKSSLAQTFKDIADNKPSKDRIFQSRVCKRTITDENNNDLSGKNIVVIRPYDEDESGHSEKTSTLLVDNKLRKEYEELYNEIDKSKEIFLKALKEQSGCNKDLTKEISSTFMKSEDEFYDALIRVKEEVIKQKNAPFSNVDYNVIFDDKVLTLLNSKDVKTAIENYIKKYNELLAASTYFKKGFNYYNAETIAKSLADNGFFDAKHTVNLNANEKIEITSKEQLVDLINREKEEILRDKELRKTYSELEQKFWKNANVRRFETYLAEHEEFLPELGNIDKFKDKIWKSYFKIKYDLYIDLIEKYQAAEKRKIEIEEIARNQQTQWEKVIESFNSRFFVPFKLIAKNKIGVITGQEPILTLSFIYEDGSENMPIEKNELMQSLSTGEKRAFYVLNIIFEVEARKKENQETLFIIDDIADSFDYKNKYAIIQYLKDITEVSFFSQIILTHNFDFFRTINSRFVDYNNCLMALKSSKEIVLEKATGIKNVFVNDWKLNFFSDIKKKIASIPFMRNLIEYTNGEDDPNYIKLTSLLHWKIDTETISQNELDNIYFSLFKTNGVSSNGKKSMFDSIMEEAKECLTASTGINFENKIVLSIAIRLSAEKFMAKKINNATFISSIKLNQTSKLLTEFKKKFKTEYDTIKIIERVLLMTPENIHLNSFMYEPILDMSEEHLKKLYNDVSELK